MRQQSLVMELQEMARKSGGDIAGLVRSALVVASKLDLDDFGAWLSAELHGYGESAEVPAYRQMSCEVKAWNPYVGWIPSVCEDESLARTISSVSLPQSIGELQMLSQSDPSKGPLQISFPPQFVSRLLAMSDSEFVPKRFLGQNRVAGVLEEVRVRILEWSLGLEKAGVLGSGLSFSEDEKAKARAAPQVSIGQFQGVMGDVHSSTLAVTGSQTHAVACGDLGALTEALRSLGVPETLSGELSEAMKADPPEPGSGQLGPKVKKWYLSVMQKALDGSIQVGANVVGGAILQMLGQYYGWHAS